MKYFINRKVTFNIRGAVVSTGDYSSDKFVPSSNNLISLEAWIPSSFRSLSICRLRAAAARSSADCVHPMSAAVPVLWLPSAPTPEPGALSPLPLHTLRSRPAAPA